MLGHSFSRYLLVGLVNTMVGYGSILLFISAAGLSPFAANAAGFALGMTLSYFLNRHITFRSGRSHRQGIPAFISAVAACYALNLAALALVIRIAPGAPGAVAQGIGVAVYTVSLFLVSRSFVFRSP